MITIFHARIVAIEPDIEDVYITATTSKFAYNAAVDYLTKQYNELYPEKDDLLIEHREAYIETFTIDITELPLIDVDLNNPEALFKSFKETCTFIYQNCEDEYAKSYALQGTTLKYKDQQVVQALYILSNLSHWRHPRAKEIRTFLKTFSKEGSTRYTGSPGDLGT